MGPKNNPGTNIELMTIQEALEKKVPTMRIGHYRDTAYNVHKCPRCGSPVACVYDELEIRPWTNYFAHVCLNPDCDFVLHREISYNGITKGTVGEKIICIFGNRQIQTLKWMKK